MVERGGRNLGLLRVGDSVVADNDDITSFNELTASVLVHNDDITTYLSVSLAYDTLGAGPDRIVRSSFNVEVRMRLRR